MKTKRCKLVLVPTPIINDGVLTITKSAKEDGSINFNHRINYCGKCISNNYSRSNYESMPLGSKETRYHVYLVDPNPSVPYHHSDKLLYGSEYPYTCGIYLTDGYDGRVLVTDEFTNCEPLEVHPIAKVLADTTSIGPSLSPSCVQRFISEGLVVVDVLVNFEDDDPISNKKGWIPVKAIPKQIDVDDVPMNAIRDIISNTYISMDSQLVDQVSEVRSFLNMYNYLIK